MIFTVGFFLVSSIPFGALTLLVGERKGIWPVKISAVPNGLVLVFFDLA